MTPVKNDRRNQNGWKNKDLKWNRKMRSLLMTILIIGLLIQPSLAWHRTDWSQVAIPPPDEIDIISKNTAALYISITTLGCLDEEMKMVTVATYEGPEIYHITLKSDGKWDGRIPASPTGRRNVIVMIKGLGSAQDPTTWKAEYQDVVAYSGGRYDITFNGAAARCWL